MISRFTRLFKKNDGDELRAFQRSVIELLQELYPERRIAASDDPYIIMEGERKYGLSNLHAKFLLTAQTSGDLKNILLDHFQKVIADTDLIDREELTWEDAKPQLMPQLMPEEFTLKMPVVNQFVGDQVRLGFVIDQENSYSYVTESDIERWRVDTEELKATAFENLHQRSQGIEMVAVEGDNGFVAVNTQDGFDAVRIASSEFRQFVGDVLGYPYYAGVPNRDFLICWSGKGDGDFQKQMRSQIARDFDEQPYPLSNKAFIAADDGALKQEQATQGSFAEFAGNN